MQEITENKFAKGDKITLEYTDADGNTVTEEKTVRMTLPDKNAIVCHFKREMVKFPVCEGDSGAVESKTGTFKGYNPQIA